MKLRRPFERYHWNKVIRHISYTIFFLLNFKVRTRLMEDPLRFQKYLITFAKTHCSPLT